MSFGPDGSVYRVDPPGHSVQRLDAAGEVLWTLESAPQNDGELNYPSRVVWSPTGDAFVLGYMALHMLDTDNGTLGEVALGAEDLSIGGLVFVDGGYAYSSPSRHRVHTPSGEFGELGYESDQHLNLPSAMVLHPDGHLHIVDRGNVAVDVFDLSGNHQRTYGGYGEGDGQLLSAVDIAVDASGTTYIADASGGRVVSFDAAGWFVESLDVIIDGNLAHPSQLSWRAPGELYATASPGYSG